LIWTIRGQQLQTGPPHLHAQDGSETDHFSLDIFRFFFGIGVRPGILPDYTDDLLRKARRPLMDWRRQMRGNRRANGSSQIPMMRRPIGQSMGIQALSGSVRLNRAVLSEIVE
jgi:hypothetical protein